MKTTPPGTDPQALNAAFALVFRKGRAPPSCPSPDESDLLNRIRDAAPAATPAACRDALIRVRRLSCDVLEVAGTFREGGYGTGTPAQEAALADLAEKDPGFTPEDYQTAFAIGMMWASF